MIRQVAQGRQPLPEDPIARAAVERQVRRIKVKKSEKDADPMEPAVPLEELLTQEQITDPAQRQARSEEGACWRRSLRSRSTMWSSPCRRACGIS